MADNWLNIRCFLPKTEVAKLLAVFVQLENAKERSAKDGFEDMRGTRLLQYPEKP